MKKGSKAQAAMRRMAIAIENHRKRRVVEEKQPLFQRPALSDDERVNMAAAFKDTLAIAGLTVPMPTVKTWHIMGRIAQLTDLIAIGPMLQFSSKDEKRRVENYRAKVHSLSGIRWEPACLSEVAANLVYLLVYPAHARELKRRVAELEAKQRGWNIIARGRRALEIAELRDKIALVEGTPEWIEARAISQWQIDWMDTVGIASCAEDIANEAVSQIENYLGTKKKAGLVAV